MPRTRRRPTRNNPPFPLHHRHGTYQYFRSRRSPSLPRQLPSQTTAYNPFHDRPTLPRATILVDDFSLPLPPSAEPNSSTKISRPQLAYAPSGHSYGRLPPLPPPRRPLNPSLPVPIRLRSPGLLHRGRPPISAEPNSFNEDIMSATSLRSLGPQLRTTTAFTTAPPSPEFKSSGPDTPTLPRATTSWTTSRFRHPPSRILSTKISCPRLAYAPPGHS
ncbi:hypothetical protein NEOLEDRAFT_758035 [Neolentinus lepideus HHB14362 ss-1]|uniref:Uncharacterized protein n=1 Tax=Neolentinus lepideus HHB14362 ss-1 TaxID=1314782 RepID=A0A165PRS7_9AGAM|nr:hypothetical protein NEOLEDRAFT_758035 [Neolentinus lepideus HHB14362 ss-1]